MSITFQKTNFDGLYVVSPHIFQDDRGTYIKYYEKHDFLSMGIACSFNESSNIISKKGSLRGLHYQTRNSQAKLIRVISGLIFDVALDLRNDSPTFGKFYSDILSDNCYKAIYIPAGFAHGYISLTNNTIFSYQCTGVYIPDACGGIKWDDPLLNIPWPLHEYGIQTVITSEKDQSWPTFDKYREGK